MKKSIIGILSLITVVYISYCAFIYVKQSKEINSIRDEGFVVITDGRFFKKPVALIGEFPRGAKYILPKIPDYLSSLKKVKLWGQKISKENLDILLNSNLEILILRWSAIENCSIPEMKLLRKVDFSETDVSNELVTSIIKNSPNLEELDLSDTNISDLVFMEIIKLKRLKSIYISGTKISENAMRMFKYDENIHGVTDNIAEAHKNND